MTTALLLFHYLICFFLIAVILLQVGKGADIGAAFGAGGSQTVFGPRGAATFLSKLTAVAAILFIFTSIGLARLAKQGSDKSVLEKVPAQTMESTPSPGEAQQPPLTTPESKK